MILKVFSLIKNIFFNIFFLFSMKVTKPYKIWSKYNNFKQKSTKYDKINFEKYKFWHFWASFFVFQGKFLSLEFFIWHTLKQQIKTRHLEKIPAQKNHFNSSYDFLYLFFYQKRQFLAVFALKRAKLIFFFSKLTMLSVIEG